jgi:Flp pilus assembly protein TadG
MTRLSQFLKDDSGTASIEFLLVFPIVFLVFTASFESSMFMARYVMLERGVDLVVRKLRLGMYSSLTHNELKEKICESGLMVESMTECKQSMKIWMQPVNTGNFDMVAPPKSCVDSTQNFNLDQPPANEFAYGTDNDIMLVRICLKDNPMFPTTGVSVKMPIEADGNYAMIVTTVFVNEPGT